MMKLIKDIRAEIFRLALQSPDLETMHWYTSLDECFENDEIQIDEVNNMTWRAWVLNQKKEPVSILLWLIDKLIQDNEEIREIVY